MYFPESAKDWPGEQMRKEMCLASENIEGKIFYLSKNRKIDFLEQSAEHLPFCILNQITHRR
jgi:hypothetical protein